MWPLLRDTTCSLPLPIRRLGADPHHRATWLPVATCSTFCDPRLRVECARFDLDGREHGGRAHGGWREHRQQIVDALAETCDEGEQREAVLAAWRTFELEYRAQFPELVPSAVGSGYAGITSGRVLNARHATAGRGGRGAAQVGPRRTGGVFHSLKPLLCRPALPRPRNRRHSTPRVPSPVPRA
ncbi:hypothetical protein DFH06DRAFT_728298 [Mycena polygramma]|nr:hypothetical protein DFH06DRAFT_728298 [Mycena polygramma]